MSAPRPLDIAELRRHPLPEAAGGSKNSRGTVLIVGGSRDVPGAPLLSAHAAMRAGAGKLQLAVPDQIAIPLGVNMPEAMVVGCPTADDGGFDFGALNKLEELMQCADAIVAGPAMRDNQHSDELVKALSGLETPVALDAALLHALGRNPSAAHRKTAPVLLPHAGEMSSLLDCEPSDILVDPVGAGRTCAARYEAIVLVKGSRSFVVNPEGAVWCYDGGSSGLAISGSGDVLAGLVGGLLARGSSPLDALLWAVWVHGEAGRKLEAEGGAIGFLAREIPVKIPVLLAS